MRAAPQNYLVAMFMQMHFAPIIWLACLTTVTVFFLKVVGRAPGDPRPANWMMICSVIVLISFSFGLVLMAIVNVSDPGYVPKRGERSRQRGRGYAALTDADNLDCPALWAGNWEQLCVTCKIVRPLRAKHDPVSNRCIEVGTLALSACDTQVQLCTDMRMVQCCATATGRCVSCAWSAALGGTGAWHALGARSGCGGTGKLWCSAQAHRGPAAEALLGFMWVADTHRPAAGV